MLVVAPRLVFSLLGESDRPPAGPDVWGDTKIVLPSRPGHANCRNIFTGTVLDLPLVLQAV